MRIVIAIGGNAIVAEDQGGTWAEQQANAATVAGELAALRRDGHELVLTGSSTGPRSARCIRSTPMRPTMCLRSRSTRWWQ